MCQHVEVILDLLFEHLETRGYCDFERLSEYLIKFNSLRQTERVEFRFKSPEESYYDRQYKILFACASVGLGIGYLDIFDTGIVCDYRFRLRFGNDDVLDLVSDLLTVLDGQYNRIINKPANLLFNCSYPYKFLSEVANEYR